MTKHEIPPLPVQRIPCDAVTNQRAQSRCKRVAAWYLEFPGERVHLCVIHNRQLDKEDGVVTIHDGRKMFIWAKDEYRLTNNAVAS